MAQARTEYGAARWRRFSAIGAGAAALWPSFALAEGFSFTNQGFYFIDFALLVGALWWLTRKPIAVWLETRRANVLAEMQEAQRLVSEAQSTLAEYEAKLRDLEAERQRIMADFVKAGEREHERLLAEAQKAADRIVAETQRRVDQEGKRLLELLEREVIDAALAAAETAVKAKVTPDVQKRLFEESISAIEQSGDKLNALL